MSTFITRLQNIKITGALYKGVGFGYGLYLANDLPRVKRLVSGDFVKWIGQLETAYLLKCDAYLYAPTENTAKMGGQVGTLNNYLGLGQLALTSIWLVRDNAINLDTGFLIPATARSSGGVFSSVFSARFTDASGSQHPTVFSREELRQAATFLSTWVAAEGENDTADQPDLFRNAARLDRVLFFLQAARAQNKLPLKIAHYCTCFETLFTTDSNEVSHKVAERVARFLGGDQQRRQCIYDQMKDAYTIRSNVLHGDTLPKKFRNNVDSYSVACDDLLRSAISKILEDPVLREMFSGSKKQLDAYFKAIIFY